MRMRSDFYQLHEAFPVHWAIDGSCKAKQSNELGNNDLNDWIQLPVLFMWCDWFKYFEFKLIRFAHGHGQGSSAFVYHFTSTLNGRCEWTKVHFCLVIFNNLFPLCTFQCIKYEKWIESKKNMTQSDLIFNVIALNSLYELNLLLNRNGKKISQFIIFFFSLQCLRSVPWRFYRHRKNQPNFKHKANWKDVTSEMKE